MCIGGNLCYGSPRGQGVEEEGARSVFLPLVEIGCLSPPLAGPSSRRDWGSALAVTLAPGTIWNVPGAKYL